MFSDGPFVQSGSAPAFCQGRQKLVPFAVLSLNDHRVETYRTHFALRRWRGRRLRAVDGSTVRLPPTPDACAAFGPPPEGSRIPLARTSMLYDVLNTAVVEADLVPTTVGELVLAGEHLAATRADDLVFYDRGYPAFWLFALHALGECDFCMRVPLGFSQEVIEFVASGALSATVTFTPSAVACRQCAGYGLPSAPLKLRLVRVTLKGVHTEVLATSLLDEAAFPTHDFKHLYHLRWRIEEQYKRTKCRLEIENFSGRSAESIHQDFYAKLFVLNLAAFLARVAQAVADRLYRQSRRIYRVNFANAPLEVDARLHPVAPASRSPGACHRAAFAMAASVEAVRPDRSAPHRMTPAKPQGLHPNYRRYR